MALLLLLAPVVAQEAAAPVEALVDAALVADDVCPEDGSAECSLSLRQLRAKKQTLAAQDTETQGKAPSPFAALILPIGGDDEKTDEDDKKIVEAGSATLVASKVAAPEAAKAVPAAESTAPLLAAVNATSHAKAGSCSADDMALIKKFGSGHSGNAFPNLAANCGKHSWSLWSGFHESDFNSCLEKKTSISSSCAACFGGSGKFGYDHCKMQCLFSSWCGTSCLDCSKRYQPTLEACVGVGKADLPSADGPC